MVWLNFESQTSCLDQEHQQCSFYESIFSLTEVELVISYIIFCFHSMEQSVSQATSVNHAAELDQILPSYKVNMTLISFVCFCLFRQSFSGIYRI